MRPGEPLRPKLTDFGIARIVDATRLTATGTMVGTAAYLSPEQAMGSPLSPATDIYSLGLVLLECIKGTVEYPGGAVESAVARLHRAPEIPEDLPAEWAHLLASMTAIEPAGQAHSRRPGDRPPPGPGFAGVRSRANWPRNIRGSFPPRRRGRRRPCFRPAMPQTQQPADDTAAANMHSRTRPAGGGGAAGAFWLASPSLGQRCSAGWPR